MFALRIPLPAACNDTLSKAPAMSRNTPSANSPRKTDFSQGQLMSNFALKLKRLWEQADIHKIDPEELLVFRYLTGCTDTKLHNELLKLEEPTVKKLNDRINHCLLYTSPSPRDRG